MTDRLKNKLCIITGAGRGIGEAIARAFAREGASVVVTDIDVQSAARLAKELGATALELDVASEADWKALSEVYPEVDVVVNNAGVTGFETHARAQDPENAALADWQAVHRVNTDGTFLGCRYAIKALRARGARYSLQFYTPCRHFNADVGANARNRARSRSQYGRDGCRHAHAAIWAA